MARKHAVFLADDMNSHSPTGRLRFELQRDCAGVLAKKLGLPIEVIHVEEPDELPYSDPAYQRLLKTLRASQKRARRVRRYGFPVPVHYSLRVGDPAEQILQATHRGGADVLVLGTHGRRGIQRLLLGSVAEEVIRGASVPVLTIGPVAQGRKFRLRADKPLKLIVATDLGSNSRKAEDFAIVLAKKLGASVVLVHGIYHEVHPVLQTAFSAPGETAGLAGLMGKLRVRAYQRFVRHCARFQAAGVKCESVLSDQLLSAEKLILSQIVPNCSLLVMGTHARRNLSRAFLGSTARKMLLSSPVPVITVASRS